MRSVSFFAAAAVLVFLPGALQAFDLGEVKINGFVSQGYLKSSDNNFLADSEDGTFQFNEVGLTFNTQVTDKLRIGAQLLSRDLGEVGDNEVRLDWGFADYRFNQELGVRIGKVKLPMGLYNEGRDSDFLRPMVFLPQSIYDETKRELLVAYQGAGLYGNFPLGPVGDLDYHAFGGTINFPEDAFLLTALKQNAAATLRQKLGPGPQGLISAHMPEFTAYHAARLNLPASDPQVQAAATADAQQYVQSINVNNLELNNDYIGGGALVLNTAVDGLRFGLSYLRVKNEIEFTLNKSISSAIDPLNPSEVFSPTRLKGSLENKSTIVGSAEYVIGNLLLAAEYAETDREQIFAGNTSMNATSQSYYGMASYTLFDRLTLSLLYDVYYQDKDDKDGKKFVTEGANRQDFFTWRKDLGFGARYDINPFWTVKAEYHRVDGASLFMTVVNDPADLEEEWDYYAFKASFNF